MKKLKWILDKPFALSMDDWDKWHKQSKKTYPIRYFIQEEIPKWYRTKIYYKCINPIEEWWYIQKCKYIHEYKRHIIFTDLSPNYYDQLDRILHGVMTCLVEFVENEAEHTDWKGTSEEAYHAFLTMTDVYKWWTQEWPHREKFDIHGKKIPDYPTPPKNAGMMWMFSDKWKDTPEREEWSKISKQHTNAEKEWNNMEEQQLIRIIKVRQYMWG